MHRISLIGLVTVLALVLAPVSPRPAAGGVYACPDMTGPSGIPDGQVNASDLSAFAAAKANQTSNGDFNTDVLVNAVDQAMFVQVFGQSNFICEDYWVQQHSRTPSCVDMNLDGYVDASDVSAFAAAKDAQNVAGDFSGDGQVDAVDQTILELALGSVGQCGIVVDYNPEPQLPPVEQLPPQSGVVTSTEPAPISIEPTDVLVQPTPSAPATADHETILKAEPPAAAPTAEVRDETPVSVTTAPALTQTLSPSKPRANVVNEDRAVTPAETTPSLVTVGDDTSDVSAASIAPDVTQPVAVSQTETTETESPLLATARAVLKAIGLALRSLLNL